MASKLLKRLSQELTLRSSSRDSLSYVNSNSSYGEEEDTDSFDGWLTKAAVTQKLTTTISTAPITPRGLHKRKSLVNLTEEILNEKAISSIATNTLEHEFISASPVLSSLLDSVVQQESPNFDVDSDESHDEYSDYQPVDDDDKLPLINNSNVVELICEYESPSEDTITVTDDDDDDDEEEEEPDSECIEEELIMEQIHYNCVDHLQEAQQEHAILFTGEYTGILACKTTEMKLFYACRMSNNRGLATLQRLLLQLGTDNSFDSIRDQSSNNCTLMHAAASGNNIDCMQLLVELGSDVNSLDNLYATPLHYACARGCHESVHFLATNGAHINAKDQYEAFPLLVAMTNNYPELMRTLVLYNADVHLKGKKGDSCLHIASRKGYRKRMNILIDELNASIYRLNSDNEHVLFCCLQHPSITQSICDRVDYKGMTKMVSSVNVRGRTVFHVASDNGYLESLLVIIQSLTQKVQTDTKTLDTLLELRMNELDNDGFAPIHLATRSDHENVVKILAGCIQVNINSKDKRNGNTALHLAIIANNVTLVQMLVELGGADLTIKNNSGDSCEALAKNAGIEILKPTSLKRRVSRTISKMLLPIASTNKRKSQ
jgi:ankyrin repeat protein